jgi:hypothetical protein
MDAPRRFFGSLTTNNRVALLCGSAILALGLTVSSMMLANGLVRMQRADREVTVRGVAQREVTANRASWRVNYSDSAYDLSAALAAVDGQTAMIRDYLNTHGFSGTLTEPGSANVSVSDEMIENKPTGRKIYSVSRAIAFTTDNVAGVEKVQAEKDALAQQGLVVGDVGASYEYTKLDTIKPDMIADATHDARRAAEKFANDSGASVGGIRSATQGYFSVSSREAPGGDEESGGSGQTANSPDQRVRVVTTINYYLD